MRAVTSRISTNGRRSQAIARVFSAVLFLAVCAGPLLAKPPARLPGQLASKMPKDQRHESRRAIDQLEEEWRTAALSGNTEEMNSLLADDYMQITPNGTLQTKDETLANIRSGRMHFTTLDVSDRKVRFYGKTAVVTSRADVQATTPDGPVSGSFRYTRVYVQNPDGQWKIVSFEASRIHEPADHP